jgi:hypothetical protein
MKYTHDEIEVFKLRSRIRRLQRDLDYECIQGNLFPTMSDEVKINLQYEIKRLINRLVLLPAYMNNDKY